MKELIGKKLNCVEFVEMGGEVYGKIQTDGTNVLYQLRETEFEKPAQAVLMDLDGTTLKSEEFWMYIIQKTVGELIENGKFELENADIPFVSGFSTREHLLYCINKYCPDKSINDATAIYHKISQNELKKIDEGKGNVNAFKATEGLKEFLTYLKSKKIKIGLCTSGLDYKSMPEIKAVFKQLNMGNPLDFYDAIITGGRRKDDGNFGTLGEIAIKPHPWLYTELAYSGLKVKTPKNVIGIEDSSAGVMALRFAGFSVIGLNGGNISQSGADSLCYKKVDYLSEIISEL